MSASRPLLKEKETPRRAELTLRESFFAMASISLVISLSSLDQTIVGNVLPSITRELNGFDLYAWVATSYLLTSMIAIPIFGRLGDYFGRKPFVLTSIIVFTAASLMCGTAQNMMMLVIARGAQGIGGGMIIGSAFACIPELFPDTRRRLRWQIMLSTVSSVANATGPLLGGYLCDLYSWRAVFYLNLPLGALALVFAWRFLPYVRVQRGSAVRIDWTGGMLISILLVSLQLFVEWLPRRPSAESGLLLVIGVVSLVALQRCEQRASHPLLPSAIFETSSLRCLYVLGTMVGGIMFALLLYLPLLFQGAYGYSAADAGVLITPLALCMTLGAIVNGRIVTRLKNPNRMLYLGLALLFVGSVGYALVGSAASFRILLGLTFVTGCGLGFSMLNLTIFTQSLTRQENMGIATAMQKSLRLVGGLVAAAIVGSVVNWLYGINIERLFTAAGLADRIAHFRDPQTLMQSLDMADSRLSSVIATARIALRQCIQVGMALIAVLAMASLILLRQVPVIDFNKRPEDDV